MVGDNTITWRLDGRVDLRILYLRAIFENVTHLKTNP